jgi:transglutaminase-like putative cysteine protease
MVRHAGFVLLACALALAGCAGSPWLPVDPAAFPDGRAYRGVDAVVLQQEQTVRFHPDEETGEPVADVTVRRLTRVLSLGHTDLTTVDVSYKREFSTVIELRARALLPDGTMIVKSREDAIDVPQSPGALLYSDQRLMRLTLGDVPPLTIVESVRTVRYREPRLFLFSEEFGDAVPVLRMELRVVAPRTWEVRHGAWRLNAPEAWAPEVVDGESERELRWSRRDIPATKREDLAPPDWARVTTVAVQLSRWMDGTGAVVEGFRDARELSAWLHALAEPASRPTPELRAFTEELLASAPDDPSQRARLLYDWVRSQVRYCAVSVGYGAWVPHEAARVLDLRYGDCKDKANLLRAMLTVAGIASRLAVVFSHDGYPRRFLLPTVTGNFNHMVLVVDLPGGPVVVDPTARSVPFGRLPAGDQGADLLPLGPGGHPVEPTPVAPALENTEETELEVTLDLGDGSAAGRFTLRTRGAYGERLETTLLREGEGRYPAVMEDWLRFRAVHAEGVTAQLSDATPEDPVVVTSGIVRVPNVLSGVGDTRLLRPADFARSLVPRLHTGQRATPLVFRNTRVLRQRVRIALPPGWSATRLPEPVTVATPFAEYHLRWSLEEAQLTMERRFELRSAIVETTDYVDFRRTCEAAHKAEAEPVLLRVGPAGERGGQP